jgi:A/G-specific adenine glycosylase
LHFNKLKCYEKINHHLRQNNCGKKTRTGSLTLTHPISKKILAWYSRHQRDLPWRRTSDPYHIWVSEIMLQQTQVDTVIPYYRRFLSKFPTLDSLAKASVNEVLMVWENLGYYTRARNLHAAAKEMVDRWKGKVPDTLDDLRLLPGIGPYTAAAILSFAYNRRIAPLDGNVRRVVCRLFCIREPVHLPSTLDRISDIAFELVPEKASSSFNQGLMDLGSSICTPRKPSCEICPLKKECSALGAGIQATLPLSKKRKPLPHKSITAAILTDVQGRLLLLQRPIKGLLGGLWKFPGGEKKPEESFEQSLRRNVKEELGIRIKVGTPVISVKHIYTHFRITLHAFECTKTGIGPRVGLGLKRKWMAPSDLQTVPLSKADRKILAAMKNRHSTEGL